MRTVSSMPAVGAPQGIGAAFAASRSAFYYARVIQIPTPRWTAYDAVRFGVKMPPEVTMKTQERAYASPISYTPGK